MKSYPVYKGLQKPLSFRGLKGKYIGWGAASLGLGFLVGGLCGALINMYLGGLSCVCSIAGLLSLTIYRQKKGLYDKPRETSILIHPNKLSIRYETKKNL